MSTDKWAQRLREIQKPSPVADAKTDEIPLSSAGGGGQSCDLCRHMSRARACMEPVAAGLADSHRTVWCDFINGHGRTCPAFSTLAKD